MRARTVFPLLAVLALPLWMVPVVAQDTVTVGVGGELSAPRFEKLKVPIFADLRKAGSEKLGSYTVRVTWTPTILQYQGIDSAAFAEPLVQADSAYSYGVLWLAGISAAGASGVVGLANLVMYVSTASADSIRVQATELSAAGTLRNLFTTTTVVHRAGAFCPALGRWGDLDRDTKANSRDALAILSSIVGLPTTGFDLTLGDVDGDAITNSRDALIVLSYAVGIEIPGQRVLLVAGGLCTPGPAPLLVVVPDTADVVVNQRVRLVAFARDAGGNLEAVNNLHWEIQDPRIAVVDQDGFLVGREPGTTLAVAAIGPGVKATATVVSRLRRGTWYVDAAKAKRSPVQLGTSKYPFSTWERAAPLVSEGDTIRIPPGVHDFEDLGAKFNTGVVVLGDTLPDGTRPVLRGSPASYAYAFEFLGGLRAELRNLVLRGFYIGANPDGVGSLWMENVRIEHGGTGYGYGIYAGLLDTLSVIRSELRGDTTVYSYYGLYLWDRARLVRVHDSKISGWGCSGMYLEDVDSLDLRRSEIRRNGCSGVYASRAGAPSVSATLSGNRIVDNQGEAILMYGARTLALDHNYLEVKTGDGIRVTGPNTSFPQAGTKMTSRGDSIRFRSSFNNWLYVDDLDSVLIDSLWLESARDTAITQYGDVFANAMRLTNSKLLNLSLEGVDFRGRSLFVNNSQFTGCGVATAGSCDWAGALALAAAAHVDSGPAVTILNSTFFSVEYALYSNTFNTRAGPMVITGNTVDSVSYGFSANGDSVLAQANVLTRVRAYGLELEPSYSNRPFKRVDAFGNQITCALTAGTSYGIYSYYAPGWFQDNAITDCEWGLYAYNNFSYPLADFTARRNTVVTDTTQAVTSYGIRPDGRWRVAAYGNRVKNGSYGLFLGTTDMAAMTVDSNAVSLTRTAGIYVSASNTAVAGVKNNITGNLLDGILNNGSGTRSFTLGSFVGNGRWAVNSSAVFGADNNWWGTACGPGGPPPGSRSPCSPAPNNPADSVTTTAVVVSPYLLTAPADVPGPLPGPAFAPLGFIAAPPAPVFAPVQLVAREPAQQALEAERGRQEALAEQLRTAREAARARIHEEARRRHEEIERLRAQRRGRPPQDFPR